jgi:hypothetical protein
MMSVQTGATTAQRNLRTTHAGTIYHTRGPVCTAPGQATALCGDRSRADDPYPAIGYEAFNLAPEELRLEWECE